MKYFFIVYTARTGSTTLYLHLDQHRNLSVIGDVFQRKLTGRGLLWDHNLARINNLGMPIDAYFIKLTNSIKDKKTKAVGVKVIQNWLLNPHRGWQDLAWWTEKNLPSIIHVERKNKAKQEVSLQLARARRRFHKLPGDQIKHVPITVNRDYLIKRINKVTQINSDIKTAFAKKHSYIHVFYEDFITNTHKVTNDICDFLEVRHMEDLPLPTEKISPTDLSTVITNYRDIKDLL